MDRHFIDDIRSGKYNVSGVERPLSIFNVAHKAVLFEHKYKDIKKVIGLNTVSGKKDESDAVIEVESYNDKYRKVGMLHPDRTYDDVADTILKYIRLEREGKLKYDLFGRAAYNCEIFSNDVLYGDKSTSQALNLFMWSIMMAASIFSAYHYPCESSFNLIPATLPMILYDRPDVDLQNPAFIHVARTYMK
jgi:hypothetical protein